MATKIPLPRGGSPTLTSSYGMTAPTSGNTVYAGGSPNFNEMQGYQSGGLQTGGPSYAPSTQPGQMPSMPSAGVPNMFAMGAGQQQIPNLPGYDYQNDGSNDMFNSIMQQATGGTINSFDTAANRMRERLDSSTRGLKDQYTNRNLGRGFGASGQQNVDMFRADQAGQNAYASGLSDLSNQFEQNRMQGLNTALGAANGLRAGGETRNTLMQNDLSQRRNLQNSNFQFQGAQDTQNRQFMDKTLFDLLNNREGRMSDQQIAALQAATQKTLQNNQQTFQGGQNTQDRDLQERIKQLEEQNTNYRSSLQMGSNQYPQITQYPGFNTTTSQSSGIYDPNRSSGGSLYGNNLYGIGGASR